MAKRVKTNGKNSTANFAAYVSFPGVEHYEGTILKHDHKGVEFEYSRYGTMYQQFFPQQQIIACLGTVGSKECMIWFKTNTKFLWDKGKRDRPIMLTEHETFGSLLKGASPDLGVVLLNPEYTQIIVKRAGETGRGRKKKVGGRDKDRKENKGGESRERPTRRQQEGSTGWD